MTQLVGLPATVATERLAAEGYRVVCVETRSRKGSGGDQERVIRVRLEPDGTAVLTTARFVSLPEDANPA